MRADCSVYPSGVQRTESQTLNPESRTPNRELGSMLYRNSKLANILFAYELDRRLKGSGVTSNALSPGFIPNTGGPL